MFRQKSVAACMRSRDIQRVKLLARRLLKVLCMKKRATIEKKTRSLPHSVSAGQLSIPRLFLFLELFVGEIPDLSTK